MGVKESKASIYAFFQSQVSDQLPSSFGIDISRKLNDENLDSCTFPSMHIFTPQMHVPTSLYQCPHTLAFGMQSGHHSVRTKLSIKLMKNVTTSTKTSMKVILAVMCTT